MRLTLTRKQAARALELTFPEYRGRKVSIETCARLTFCDLNWSGGSRNRYVALDVRNGRRADLASLNRNAPWAQPMEGATVDLPAGVVVACHSTFCGKDCGVVFYVSDESALALAGLELPPSPAAWSGTLAEFRALDLGGEAVRS